MPDILVIRHGATEWSATKRLQGRKDLPLSIAGADQVAKWRIDPLWNDAICLSSPLRRCVETARILNLPFRIENALIEMDWGDFEGERLQDLRATRTHAMTQAEQQGIDFTAPNGESPRSVAARIKPLFESCTHNQVWITHKGVRNACMILSLGWNMLGKPPLKLTDNSALHLRMRKRGLPVCAGMINLMSSN